MPRINVSLRMKKTIRKLYEGRCAGCSAKCLDVGHLFEDATANRGRIDNLILLCATCNNEEDRAKFKTYPFSSSSLLPENVASVAKRLYKDGQYLPSYQSSRLAAYLYETRTNNPTMALACLTEAISSLRPVRMGRLLRATILEAHRICCRHKVGMIHKWLFVDRLALLLYDYMRLPEAASVQYAATLLQKRVSTDERDPTQLSRDIRNAFRRQTFIQGSYGQIDTRDLVSTAIPILVEDAETFRKTSDYDSFATNLDAAGKLSLEIASDRERAHRYGEQVLEFEQKITHKWVLQEHYHREALYFLGKGDKNRAKDCAQGALKLFNDHPTMLDPIVTTNGLVQHDPLKLIDQLEISNEELRERGVAPSRNAPFEEFKFSAMEIRDLVRDFLNS